MEGEMSDLVLKLHYLTNHFTINNDFLLQEKLRSFKPINLTFLNFQLGKMIALHYKLNFHMTNENY